MQVMRRLRSYHALLAILVVIAYLTGGDNSVHARLGYGVATLIFIRIAMALTGVSRLGLTPFYPHFDGLRLSTAMTHPAISRTLLLGIAACLVGVTLTGIAMDRGQAFDVATQAISSSAHADNDRRADRDSHDADKDGSPIREAHEIFANLLIVLIITHVTYLLFFKRPLALFMLFIETPVKKDEVS